MSEHLVKVLVNVFVFILPYFNSIMLIFIYKEINKLDLIEKMKINCKNVDNLHKEKH